MALICGIDEAGRGPVIGPLVMAGVLVDEQDLPKLKSMGITDSKLLTKEKREELFDKIKKIVKKYEIIIVLPQEIDDALESDELNLNWLEAHKAAEIINKLKPDKAILDCPSNNTKAYESYVKDFVKDVVELVVEHKADINYLEASAASILAKVTRDREIDKIKEKINKDIGSGYPSDPKTKEFLEKNYKKYPEIFRKTWASYQNIQKMKNQRKLGDF